MEDEATVGEDLDGGDVGGDGDPEDFPYDGEEWGGWITDVAGFRCGLVSMVGVCRERTLGRVWLD